jgi:pimeloyl-ACP methyl ester carboxylesterase
MQIVNDGLLTNYEIKGNSNKEVLLILHGWMNSLNEWIPTANELSGRYKVILLDLPGFGLTSMSEKAYSIYDYATFVEHFLDKLEIKKVTFIGHSFGGRIGIIMGANTDKIKNLILVDAAGVEKRTVFAKIKIAFFKSAKVLLPKSLVEKLRTQLGSPDYKSAGPMRDIFLKVINEDLSYLLPKIAIPTLIIWGNKDTEVQEWKTKKMKKLIKNSKLRVVWESGHSPNLEKPREFMEIVKDYLVFN